MKTQHMKTAYKLEAKSIIHQTAKLEARILASEDLTHLPPILQDYLHLVGAVGKPIPLNFRVTGSGGIRSYPDQGFMKFKSEQYNRFDRPVRAFYITARKMGIPARGLHLYKEGSASMVIKLAGLFKVVDARGPEMDQGETVTFFNDICVMAPALLIDRSIQWEVLDPLKVSATFTACDISVRADLCFNEGGELVNFISQDRYETTNGKEYHNYPWSTPISAYRNFHGFRLPSKAKLIYDHPDGDFCYGEFELTDVAYNQVPSSTI